MKELSKMGLDILIIIIIVVLIIVCSNAFNIQQMINKVIKGVYKAQREGGDLGYKPPRAPHQRPYLAVNVP